MSCLTHIVIISIECSESKSTFHIPLSPPEQNPQRSTARRREPAPEPYPLAQPYAADPSASGPLYAHAHTVR